MNCVKVFAYILRKHGVWFAFSLDINFDTCPKQRSLNVLKMYQVWDKLIKHSKFGNKIRKLGWIITKKWVYKT